MDFFRDRRTRGRPSHPDVLTPAEWRVLDEVRAGRSNAEIAQRLGVSVNTVRTQVSSMLAKLALDDRHALAAWEGEPATAVAGKSRAARLGLLSGSWWSASVRLAAVAAVTAIAVFGLAAALSTSTSDSSAPALPTLADTEGSPSAATPAAAATGERTPLFFEYTVQLGETIEGIATRFGVAPEYVRWNNPDALLEDGTLVLGAVLRIPAVGGVLHEVGPLDTVATIASTYGVEAGEITAHSANGLVEGQLTVPEGTLLLVPRGTPPQPVTLPPDLPPLALRIVELVEASDVDALMALVKTQGRACEEPGLGSPGCAAGDAPGTMNDAFPVMSCEGFWTTDARSIIEGVVASAGQPYAVATIGPDPQWAIDDAYPYGSLLIVFAPREENRVTDGVGIYSDGASIARVRVPGCARPDLMLEPGVGEAPFTVLWRTSVPDRQR